MPSEHTGKGGKYRGWRLCVFTPLPGNASERGEKWGGESGGESWSTRETEWDAQ